MLETKDYVETTSKTENLTSIEPEFKPFDYGTNEELTKPQFEIEKQYNLDSNELREFGEKAREMSFLTLDKTQDVSSEKVLAEKSISRPKLNARGKIIVSVYSIIVAIIIAFCIYNAVSISSLSSSVNAKQQIVASQTQVINELQREYNRLGDEENILASDVVDQNYKVPTSDDIVYVDDVEIGQRPEEQSHSNWFENFCRKLKDLFS